MDHRLINGFSKLSKSEKIELLSQNLQLNDLSDVLKSHWHPSDQHLFDEFSENTLTNFYLPYSIAPNFLVNNEVLHIPMVVEESSVVASASAAAKFWLRHGGFHAVVRSTLKTGHVHFTFSGNKNLLFEHWSELKPKLFKDFASITVHMENRGGGVVDILLEDCTSLLVNYFRLSATFETVDAMGANFINTVLEQMAVTLTGYCSGKFTQPASCEVIMAILSNYTPACTVKCWVEAPVSAFEKIDNQMTASKFIDKFSKAILIANLDVSRAVTNNKGIMNGVDAVVLATGNDFRAIEADVHAFAARDGQYRSLSSLEVYPDGLMLSVELPITIGTTGGLTTKHPMAQKSIEILGNPTTGQLMMIVAATGLATHFSAIRALVTKGIQHGHMKMHLSNILLQLRASDAEKSRAMDWFENKTVSFSAVSDFLNQLRSLGAMH